MTNADVLAVDDIHTYYGESYVLQGLSVAAKRGRVAVILGRNGVGKTTLIRSVIGFTPPRRGRVLFEGADIARLPSHRIARMGVGLVPQGRRIFPSLSVSENLAIAQRAMRHGSELPEWEIESVLALFPALRERLGNGAGTLSGGEQQMLAVARALLGNARLMLMDEPTEGLSPHIVEAMKQLILRLRESGMAILLVEQNLAFALDVADEVYVMDKGRIVYFGSPNDLAADDAVKETYLGV
jgi:branched-chain amino acid transport system ATP-binding protein